MYYFCSLSARALAGFLRVTPWITSVKQRIAWLNETLEAIQELIEENPDDVAADMSDHAARFLEIFGSEPPEHQLVKYLEDGFIDILSDVHRVMRDEEDLSLVENLCVEAGRVRAHRGEKLEDGAVPFF